MAKLIMSGKIDRRSVKVVCSETKDGLDVAATVSGKKDVFLSEKIYKIISETDADVPGLVGIPNLSISNAYDVLANDVFSDVESHTSEGTPRESKINKDNIY